jgi:hypothetical protein
MLIVCIRIPRDIAMVVLRQDRFVMQPTIVVVMQDTKATLRMDQPMMFLMS